MYELAYVSGKTFYFEYKPYREGGEEEDLPQ